MLGSESPERSRDLPAKSRGGTLSMLCKSEGPHKGIRIILANLKPFARRASLTKPPALEFSVLENVG